MARAVTSPEDFVRIWQTSDTIEEVCEKSKMNLNRARSRAANYRKKGVKLKHFGRAYVNDWDALAKVADDYRPKPEGETENASE